MSKIGYNTLVTRPSTGERMTVKQWAEKKWLNPDTLVYRLNKPNADIERALTDGVRYERRRTAEELAAHYAKLETLGLPLPPGVVKAD